MCGVFVARADMTSPSAESDLLMFCASLNLSPCASVFANRSLPARSISHNLLFVHSPLIKFSPLTITQCMLKCKISLEFRTGATIYNIAEADEKSLATYQCDRLLCSLAFVEPTTLALLPVCRTSQASFMLFTRASTSPGTW